MKHVIILTLLISITSCSRPEKAVEDQTTDDHSIVIEHYELRKSLIDNQQLEAWPTILQIEELPNSDSLVLYLIEESSEKTLAELYIRAVFTSNLEVFSEAKYSDDCQKEGTTMTKLKIGKNDTSLEFEVLCDTVFYAFLELQK